MVGDAGKNVREPGLWIDVTQLCGLNERIHDGGSFRPALRPREQPRSPAECEAAKRAFSCVIAEAYAAIFEESGEGFPTREHVVDRLGGTRHPLI